MKANIALKDNTTRLLYKLINNLLYFDDLKREIRLYILKTLKYEILRLAYNEIKYLDYARSYKKLIDNIYIFNLIIKLYKYLRYCSYY